MTRLRSVTIRSLIMLGAFFAGALAQTILSPDQVPPPAIRPGQGIVMQTTPDGRQIRINGATVLHLVHPPAQPGSCDPQGTGAAALDTDGYFYVCTMAGWIRSAWPMTLDWSPNQ